MQAESDVFQYLLKNLSPTCGGLLQKLSKSLNDIGRLERLEKVCSSEKKIISNTFNRKGGVVSRSAGQKQEVYYPRVSAEAEDVR